LKIGRGNNFLNSSEIKARIDKWDCIKLKSFCTSKKQLLKRKPTESGRKSLPATFVTRDHYPEYIKSSKLKHQNKNNPGKWANELDSFQNKKYKWP
jgi:hypothetical protein